MLDGSLPIGTSLGLDIALVREHPRYAAKLASRRPVHVWTVDEPDDVARCLELGAAAIITNRPAAVLRELTLARV